MTINHGPTMPRRSQGTTKRANGRKRLLRAGRVLQQAQRGALTADAAMKMLERDGIAPSEGLIGLNLLPTAAEVLARLERIQAQVERARPAVRQAIASRLSELEDALTGALVHDRLLRGKERLLETYQVRERLELDF